MQNGVYIFGSPNICKEYATYEQQKERAGSRTPKTAKKNHRKLIPAFSSVFLQKGAEIVL
jgi:hypothetical protein